MSNGKSVPGPTNDLRAAYFGNDILKLKVTWETEEVLNVMNDGNAERITTSLHHDLKKDAEFCDTNSSDLLFGGVFHI
ncbi:hypothetical protein T10_6311 [Trichinella papuae]|uniref:Uncharacterized protein n=1 Tax=Trichinella papuae TaxID=268474 RepID=A0A0V1MZL4_9BILA|nr:hypothetical protein T10_6311 [Trichinella papuae]